VSFISPVRPPSAWRDWPRNPSSRSRYRQENLRIHEWIGGTLYHAARLPGMSYISGCGARNTSPLMSRTRSNVFSVVVDDAGMGRISYKPVSATVATEEDGRVVRVASRTFMVQVVPPR